MYVGIQKTNKSKSNWLWNPNYNVLDKEQCFLAQMIDVVGEKQ